MRISDWSVYVFSSDLEANNAMIGEKVATALTGTFLGILASYGFFGPLAAALEHDAKEELNLYEGIKANLVSSASGMPPTLAVEFGRKVFLPDPRPTFLSAGPRIGKVCFLTCIS